MVKITLKRGYIGIPDKQKKVLAALGLKKIGSSVRRTDNQALQGMVRKVAHMVVVEKMDE
jgi:large subunit ribosomal protein L30